MKRLISIFTLIIVAVSGLFSQVTKYHIGSSYYDLQSNNSSERRVAVNPTTKNIIATFTGSAVSDGSFADRGTGYAYWNGSNWIDNNGNTMTIPNNTFLGRLESERVGWPSPFFTTAGEGVITHKSSVSGGGFNGLYQMSRATAGTGSWSAATLTTGAETWPRVAADGNKIVVVNSQYQSQFNGLDAGLSFIKSTDGGATWSSPDSIDGINPDNYSGMNGDIYDIDVKGNTIAILTGVSDVTLYYSRDFGTTWNKKSFISTAYNFLTELSVDNRSDGTYSVLIDNNDKIHCFWGRSNTVYGNYQGNAGNYFDISKTGIVYWNENMPSSSRPIVIPGTDFFRENTNAPRSPLTRFNRTNPNTSNTIGYTGSAGGYSSQTTSWPSSGIDASGNLYLTYAYNRGIIDTTNTGPGIDEDPNGYNLYDVYAMKSMDGGTTWQGPFNVSSSPARECSFPSMARFVDDTLTVIWQDDSLYGNAISTVDGQANGRGSQSGPIYTNNKYIVARVPVSSIVNPSSDYTPPILTINDKYRYKFLELGTEFKVVKFIGCGNDTISKQPVVLSKKFLLENLIEFRDNNDGVDTNYLFVDDFSNVNLNTAGTYTINVWGEDAAGNTTQFVNGYDVSSGIGAVLFDTVQITFEIIPDTKGPEITLLGSATEYSYLGDTYTDPGASVSDDNPCTATSYTPSGTVDINTKGTNTLKYNATDNAGNAATEKQRTVVVGVEPSSVITNESITGTQLTASASTSSDIESYTNPKFKWSVKKNNTSTTINGQSTANISNFNISSYNSFDSICVEVKNEFNTVYKKDPSFVCKELKYTSNNSGIQLSSEILFVELFPNPNTGNFQVKVSGNHSYNALIKIMNVEGKTVLEQNAKIRNGYIPIQSNLPNGTYFMNVGIDGKEFLEKFEIR